MYLLIFLYVYLPIYLSIDLSIYLPISQSICLFIYLSIFILLKYDTFNATNLIANGKRDWSYIRVNPYLDIPLSNSFTIKPSYVYYERIDKIERSGFTQHGPELQLSYEVKNTEVKADFSYLTRNYTDIDARDNMGLIDDNLTYKYTQFNINAAHKITKNLELTATIYSRIRTTNYTDIDARSFRGYRNQYAGIGFKMEIINRLRTF